MSRELPTLQDARDALALADSAANTPWADGVSVEVDSDYLRAALAAVDELTRERDSLRNELRNVIGACVVPATTQVAYADDLAAYVRACMDAVREEGRHAGLEEAAKVCEGYEYAADRMLSASTLANSDALVVARYAGKSQVTNDCASAIRTLATNVTP